jgi:hypothetical protein
MSDETGGIMATVVNGDGTKNTLTGLVERNGDFWVENVPLNGISQISIQATDAAGNVTTTNFTVNRSLITLTIDSVPAGEALWQPTGTVSGQISDPTAIVFVNGIQGTNTGNGTWSARRVPIYGTGTASFDVTATNASAGLLQLPPLRASRSIERPPQVIISHYHSRENIYWFHWHNGQPDSRTLGNTDITYYGSLTVDKKDRWQNQFSGWADWHGDYGNSPPNAPPYDDSVTWTPAGVTPAGWWFPAIPNTEYVGSGWVTHYMGGADFWYDSPPDANGDFTRLIYDNECRTALKLYTGGKAQITKKRLIALYVSGVSYKASPKDANPESGWWNASFKNIDSKYLELAGMDVRDGAVFLALPDNSEKAVTVTVTAGYFAHPSTDPPGFSCRHYSASVNPQKVDLVLDIVHPVTGVLSESAKTNGDGGYVPIYRNADTPVTQLVLRGNGYYAQSGKKVRLKFDSANYEIYRDPARTVRVASERTEFALAHDVPLYLKGIKKSSGRGKEEVTLQYQDDHDWQDGEKVLLTVVQSEFVIQVKAFIPYAWSDPEFYDDQLIPIVLIPNPLWHKVVGGDNRLFKNLYSNNTNNSDNPPNNPVYFAAPFRVCQTVILTPYKELHNSQCLSTADTTKVAPLSKTYLKTNTVIDSSEIDQIHGIISPLGEPEHKGQPILHFGVCDPAHGPPVAGTRLAGVEIGAQAADGALGVFSYIIPCIEWDLALGVITDDPIHPRIFTRGWHEHFPAYEIIYMQSDATYKDLYRFSPDPNAVPGPTTLNPNDPVRAQANKQIQ